METYVAICTLLGVSNVQHFPFKQSPYSHRAAWRRVISMKYWGVYSSDFMFNVAFPACSINPDVQYCSIKVIVNTRPPEGVSSRKQD